MTKLFPFTMLLIIFIITAVLFNSSIFSKENSQNKNIDATVRSFLEKHKDTWNEMNVPETDAKMLYDFILKNNYKNALEIGTSTGYSGIWIAWALSKTGGKLITIEISEERYKKALANFKEAGLSEYVDARLADAHELVKELKGPFDFVFCDADKDWYKNYFLDIFPNLGKGGCFTAHNVSANLFGRMLWNHGTSEYYDYIKNRKDLETTIYSGGNGLAISYKK